MCGTPGERGALAGVMWWHVTDQLCVAAVRGSAVVVVVRGQVWEYVAEHLGQPPTFRRGPVSLGLVGSHSGADSCAQSGRNTG